jgi:hypothetical protein
MGEGPQLSHDQPTGVFTHVAHITLALGVCRGDVSRGWEARHLPFSFLVFRRIGFGRSGESPVGAQHCCAPVGKVASGTTVAGVFGSCSGNGIYPAPVATSSSCFLPAAPPLGVGAAPVYPACPGLSGNEVKGPDSDREVRHNSPPLSIVICVLCIPDGAAGPRVILRRVPLDHGWCSGFVVFWYSHIARFW